MKSKVYEEVVAIIKTYSHRRECLQALAQHFPKVPQDTLLSIFSQYYQQYTKTVHQKHRKSTSLHDYYEQYISKSGNNTESVLLEMANEASLSPTLFARLILEEYIHREDLLPPKIAISSLVSQWIKSPTSIPDLSLQKQVNYCVLNDMNYGPLAENLKHSVGYQYEFLLLEKIQELGIPYLDERALRLGGYDKTPDFKLEVPIAVNGQIVNWIESKASFGDELSHSKYLEEQFWSYQNRFGSGMVIYWFGYIEELDTHEKQGIMLADAFPDKSSITLLTTGDAHPATKT